VLTVIEDDQRQALTGLALRALDTITEEYGEDAELRDAVIVFEVGRTDTDGETISELLHHSTSHRSTVVVGMLQSCAHLVTSDWTTDLDEE
jgi:hypothetical protein